MNRLINKRSKRIKTFILELYPSFRLSTSSALDQTRATTLAEASHGPQKNRIKPPIHFDTVKKLSDKTAWLQIIDFQQKNNALPIEPKDIPRLWLNMIGL